MYVFYFKILNYMNVNLKLEEVFLYVIIISDRKGYDFVWCYLNVDIVVCWIFYFYDNKYKGVKLFKFEYFFL